MKNWTDEEKRQFETLAKCAKYMGDNYLVAADGTVYIVVLWAQGGEWEEARQVIKRGDPHYETHLHEALAPNRGTVFEDRDRLIRAGEIEVLK